MGRGEAQNKRICSARYEREARQCGWQRIAGLDDAGRGSLFGPVLATGPSASAE